MKKNSIIPLLFASFLLVVTACGTGSKVLNDVMFEKDDYQKVVSANNELGFKLLGEVEGDENDNTFISPTSLLMALSMVYNGADGETKEEIAKTLQLEGIDVTDLNKANASLGSILKKDSDEIQVDIANSIWLNENFHFQDDFAQNNKDYFHAEITEIDLSDKDSAKQINDWVKASTSDKITEIVEAPLDDDLVTLLVNAIYFKGNWTNEFDKSHTEIRPFHLVDGTTKDVPLMTLYKELAYMENEKFQAVTLPYGDEEMNMKVFLPKENTSLTQFKESLTSENWAAWDEEFLSQEGTILLPKFQIEYETLLKETLGKLGMHAAFMEDADFTKMIKEDRPVFISEVKQKTFIDVNEEGTEAAAVTSIDMKTTSMPIETPFEMEVNRPFFIAITDNETDTILFMGSIGNPQQEK